MYNRCYVHSFDDPDCPINAQALAALEAWRATGTPLLIYGYEFDIFNQAMHVPFYTMLADEIRRFHKLGIVGVIPETIPMNYRPAGDDPAGIPYNSNRLAYYLYARLLWNPALDDREIIREFSRTAFAAAGDAMSDYFILLADAWDAMPQHYSYYGASPLACAGEFLSGDVPVSAEAALARAREAAGTIRDTAIRDRVRREIETEAGILKIWSDFRDSYRAAQASLKLIVPRAAAPGDFSGAVAVPAFRTASAAAAPDTAMRINYDDNALYFEIVCRDSDPGQRVARRTGHDSEVWADESIELFIGIPNDPLGVYRHFAVNRNAARYDAVAMGGSVYNSASFNPEWDAEVDDQGAEWRVRIALPFAALGRAPAADEVWRFTVKHSNGGRADLPVSGFPDAVYHDLNSFGMLQFSATDRSLPLLLVSPKVETPELELLATLGRAGFQTQAAADWREAGRAAIIVIRSTPELNLAETTDFSEVKQALERGAMVIFAGYGALPLERWFGDPGLAVTWSGWEIAPDRRTVGIMAGAWSTGPDDLKRALEQMSAPSSGYRPRDLAGWMALAELKMRDGSTMPYLLARRVGRGLLVVTGADFGLGGGAVLFGSGALHTIPMLLRNLYAGFLR